MEIFRSLASLLLTDYTLRDYTLRGGGFANDLFLLSRALHSGGIINREGQAWCGVDTYPVA